VKAGDEIPSLTRVTDEQQMKLMAALLHDPNPIHFDVESVRTLGLGDRVIAQGPMTLSFVSEMLTSWAGGIEALRSLEMRMLGNVFGGDAVRCTGRIAEIDAATGVVRVDVEASVDGRQVVAGVATLTPHG
jgi:acyl dehydratase